MWFLGAIDGDEGMSGCGMPSSPSSRTTFPHVLTRSLSASFCRHARTACAALRQAAARVRTDVGRPGRRIRPRLVRSSAKSGAGVRLERFSEVRCKGSVPQGLRRVPAEAAQGGPMRGPGMASKQREGRTPLRLTLLRLTLLRRTLTELWPRSRPEPGFARSTAVSCGETPRFRSGGCSQGADCGPAVQAAPQGAGQWLGSKGHGLRRRSRRLKAEGQCGERLG